MTEGHGAGERPADPSDGSGPAGPVLLVLPSLAVGGTEGHVAGLARFLARRGPGAAVACLVRGGPLAGPLARAGVEVEILGLRGVLDPRATLRLLALMLRLRPSAVHAFLFGFDAVAALPARLARTPLVLGSRREVAGWMRGRHLLVQALGTDLVDRVVCCSDTVRRHALATEGGAADKYVVVRNGVDLAAFRPDPERRAPARAALGLQPDTIAALTVANLAAEKGHEVLLEAAAAAARDEPRLCLLWAGEGPCRIALAARIRALGLERRVRLLGEVADVPALLRAADLFVLPSRTEGLPNALLEAMAAGVAAVATDVGGVAEIVGGSDGAGAGEEAAAVVVPPADPVALAAAISRLAADPFLRASLGRRARARAERFPLAAAHAALLSLYRDGEASRALLAGG